MQLENSCWVVGSSPELGYKYGVSWLLSVYSFCYMAVMALRIGYCYFFTVISKGFPFLDMAIYTCPET
jgi:hypothetical protein